jgi:microcin C transport system substrate-binding protein
MSTYPLRGIEAVFHGCEEKRTGGTLGMFKGKYRIVVIIIAVCVVLWWLAKANQPPASGGGGVGGGQLTLQTSIFPKTFNAMVSNEAYASAVFELVYDTLLDRDYNTLEYKPLIAQSWTISEDKKEFTFKIDPRAKWSDGKPITAADVKFTYDTMMNPKNLTSVLRLYYGRLNPPEVIDAHTVKFTSKTVHYKNFEMLAAFTVLPKHLMEGKDFNKDFNMNLPGSSGPYRLSEVKEGRYYVLTRRQDYWADVLPHFKGTYNFSKIKYKVMEPNVAFEAFKRGDFDIYDDITPKRWVTETDSEPFLKNWIVKQKIFNATPRGFRGITLNLRRPVFKDLKVRQALMHLLDRKSIIDKLMYGELQPLNSYWQSFFGVEANPEFSFAPVTAKRLLAEAGYQKLGKDGYLLNHFGQRLEFTILYVSEENEKYLTLFAETCKKAGIKVTLQRLSWATLIKQTDEFKFDAVAIGSTGVLSPDPEQLWHSKHSEEVGGSNLPGYQDPEVDGLIDSLPANFDPNRRLAIIQQIDHKIYQAVPYLLFWESDHNKIFYKNIFGMPKTVFHKYASGIIKYWWYDPVKVKKYRDAVKSRRALPAQPVEIYYDEVVNK